MEVDEVKPLPLLIVDESDLNEDVHSVIEGLKLISADKMQQDISKREVFEEWCAQSVTMIVGRL